MKEKICEVCKIVFKTYKKNQRFCSQKCFGKSNSIGIFKNGCEVNLGRKRPDVIERNKQSIGKPTWNKGKKGIYSKEALLKMSNHRKGKVASEETKKKLSIIHKGKKHSLEARIKMSIAHKGEKGSNWKGGVTPLIRQIRKSFEYSLWRMSVFQRDNFTCCVCKKKGGWDKKLKIRIIIHVDHIKSFAFIFYENKIKTFEEALICKDFWDINNGRTLCKQCHAKTDTWGVNIRI